MEGGRGAVLGVVVEASVGALPGDGVVVGALLLLPWAVTREGSAVVAAGVAAPLTQGTPTFV